MTPEMQGKMRNYLLGRVTEAEREEIEKAILTDDAAFEELQSAESELVDDFVSGDLPPADHSEVEHTFFNYADTKQELRFSRALHRYVQTNTTATTARPTPANIWWKQPWVLRSAAAFAILVVVVGSIWYVRRQRQPQTLVALTLTLGASNRGEGNKVPAVRLPLSGDALKLDLALPDPSPATYRVTLVSSLGEEQLPIA